MAVYQSKIREVSKNRFETGEFADAALAAFREVNTIVKAKVESISGEEYDGNNLMNHAFSVGNPIIELSDLIGESKRNVQQGFMQIFAGAMSAIRNPKAHENLILSPEKAIHFIFLASLLMMKLDDAERIAEGKN